MVVFWVLILCCVVDIMKLCEVVRLSVCFRVRVFVVGWVWMMNGLSSVVVSLSGYRCCCIEFYGLKFGDLVRWVWWEFFLFCWLGEMRLLWVVWCLGGCGGVGVEGWCG